MNKIILYAILALVILVMSPPVSALSPVSGHKITIDPGHGGSDPGTTECATKMEKDANLEIALKLKGMLTAQGAIVYMTRTDDSNPGNTQRANVANNSQSEAMISIHLNGSTNHAANKTSVLYGKPKKDKQLADVVHPAQLQYLSPIADGGTTNFASGAILKATMPAIITESVYLSNTNECALMSDGTMVRQTQIAQSIFNGLEQWFSKM